MPHYFCFGQLEEDLCKFYKVNVKNFYKYGSIRLANLLQYVNENKIKLNKNRYDICLISEPHTCSDLDHVENFDEAPGIIAEYTHRLCKQEYLNLIFSGKSVLGEIDSDYEIYYYKEFLKKYDFKISSGL